MTDWNPVENIGIRLKPLVKSIYQEIITDNIWAYQRDNYGYRNLFSADGRFLRAALYRYAS